MTDMPYASDNAKVCIVSVVLALFILLSAGSNADAMPAFKEVKAQYRKSDAVLLDRHGKVIHELRVDPKGRRLDWVGAKEISPALIRSIIRSEDRRFYEHSGVDWRAAATAFVENIFSKGRRGASTITMQLVSVIDRKLRPGDGKRTIAEKWEQMKAAEELEKTWTKDQILDAYLNLITFRGELQGISAASRGLFDKGPGGLDDAESLILAALIRSPNAPVEKVIKRACMLGGATGSKSSCEDIKAAALKSLSVPYTIAQRIALAPHVAHMLLRKGKTAAASTLDGGLQRFASEVLRRQIMSVGGQNVNEGALIVVENKTGDVLAYVGSVGSSEAGLVDGIRARRQAGSTLKPFLYSLAFEKRILTPASLIKDSPLDVPTRRGLYRPGDYESDFKGLVSARTALASSLNIPAVRTLSLVGVEPFVQRLNALGFSGLRPDDYYGLSLALGTADVSLYELVNAYRTLANNGVYGGMGLVPGRQSGPRKQVISKDAAYLVSDILSDRDARSVTFGFENPLSTRYWTAVKTGTSKDMRDNWCIGYSGKYTVGVWVGNFSGEPMWNVSGITGAAPVWVEVMDHLHERDRSRAPVPPAGVISKSIAFDGGIEPARKEWFIRDTETELVRYRSNSLAPRITYPAKGTVIALDPDIPEDRQRVFFETDAGEGAFLLSLDGATLGSASGPLSWKPEAGDHIVSLIDRDHRVLDTVEFKVKGSW
jgi:penicillin-binding protein 1C